MIVCGTVPSYVEKRTDLLGKNLKEFWLETSFMVTFIILLNGSIINKSVMRIPPTMLPWPRLYSARGMLFLDSQYMQSVRIHFTISSADWASKDNLICTIRYACCVNVISLHTILYSNFWNNLFYAPILFFSLTYLTAALFL